MTSRPLTAQPTPQLMPQSTPKPTPKAGRPLRRAWVAGVVLASSLVGLAAAQGLRAPAGAGGLLASPASAPAAVPAAAPSRRADHIVAVVNQEAVTASEVERRIAVLRDEQRRRGGSAVPAAALAEQALESLIEERAVLTHARETGGGVDEAEIDRAVRAVAAQNRLDLEQLRQRLAAEGLDMTRLRAQLRDQILVERVRERDVLPRIQVTETEVDEALEDERRQAQRLAQLHVAQMLVAVPEGADASVVAARRSRAQAAAERVRAGEAFEVVARQVSDAADAAQGGSLGMRPPSRLPALFVEAVRDLKPGELAPALVRSGAGFHVLKLVDRQAAAAATVQQTRVRHILLRPTDRQPVAEAASRLEAVRRQIERGERRFEEAAREISEDGSAAQGGDLGWAVPGMMVPEFEQAMDALVPGRVSAPVASRFGVHLIEVLERRQVEVDPRQRREQLRAALRERRFADAYQTWVRELRERAWVERRDPLS